MVPVQIQLIYPMFAMFVLSAFVLMKTFMARYNAVKSGQVKISYFKTFTGGEGTELMTKTSRHFANIFEAPILFYVACLIAMILPVQGLVFVALSWLYVIFRVLHTYIHLGSNDVIIRMRCYFLSWVVLIVMWLMIFVRAVSISSLG